MSVINKPEAGSRFATLWDGQHWKIDITSYLHWGWFDLETG